MSVPFSVSSKLPGEKLDFTIDWTDPLDGATVNTSTFTVPGGLLKESTSNTSSTTTVTLSGGSIDAEYDVENTIEDSDGLTHVRVLRIVVGFLVTEPEVKAIIDTSSDNLQPYIIAAYRVVKDNIGSSVPDFTKKEIQRWLAAHFLAMEPQSDGRIAEKEVMEARNRFVEEQADFFTAGIGSTRYGQQAMALDISGRLAQLGKRRAGFKAVNFRVK